MLFFVCFHSALLCWKKCFIETKQKEKTKKQKTKNKTKPKTKTENKNIKCKKTTNTAVQACTCSALSGGHHACDYDLPNRYDLAVIGDEVEKP